ncbi:NAD-dependent epimerase/dehydratase family protein [Amnibacterium kyonggiense]|uniref:Nucleoside-diphosphate-sugar epimerase n=1 Tax=Amnibacterium kyonggiense TaxID=595671 RepID=A0A4V3EAX4_9MICO|nr:NAD-dependent epimerase/dehydratase family protein [Amnibacterium kyonggiense]TDS76994.1 nucleoside-diphosphate-sugar epimerase [Amnibacterium kyonggiense]
MALDILFLGGTGAISTASVRLAVERGHRVTVLNRGRTTSRSVPDAVEHLVGDVADPASVDAAVAGREFDVVAQFRAFTTDTVQGDVDRFRGRVGQYVFISSASAYQKPPAAIPVTESTPLKNPFWQYSRDKIACEDLLVTEDRERDFPVTIVRPSHTYDDGLLPTMGGWTDIARMRAGKPVLVHGDGTTPWTLTHSDDFAVGFVGLLGRPEALGNAYTITGESAPTWNQVYTWLGRAAGVEPELVHLSSERIAKEVPDLGPGLVGDKAHAMLFDTTKLRRLVPEFTTTIPYAEGARRQIAWYDAHPEAQVVDEELDATFDRLIALA